MTRMKELRKKKGFSQVRMQMLTGIDQSDYSKIETGKRNMSFEQCRRIALALETSMDYLAGPTDQDTIPEQSKTTASASFLLEARQASNAASARTAETELSKVDVVLTGSAMGRIIQKGGARPLPFGR